MTVISPLAVDLSSRDTRLSGRRLLLAWVAGLILRTTTKQWTRNTWNLSGLFSQKCSLLRIWIPLEFAEARHLRDN
jgi:hypothetical protein